jgi:hypothetical protein
VAAQEEVVTSRGRKARWARSSQFWRLYMTIAAAPLYAEICKFWYAPRSLRTGDGSFDKRWHTFGAPDASLTALLSPPVRVAIANCPSLESIQIDGDELCVACGRWRNDEAAMLALAERLADGLERIKKPRDDSELAAAKQRSAAIYTRKVFVFIAVVVVLIAVVALASWL